MAKLMTNRSVLVDLQGEDPHVQLRQDDVPIVPILTEVKDSHSPSNSLVPDDPVGQT